MTSMEQALVRGRAPRIRVKVVSGRHKFARRLRNERRYGRDGAADSRLGYAERLADFRLCAIMPHIGQCGHYRPEKTEAWRPIRRSRPGLHGIYPDAEVDDFFAIEPGGYVTGT